MKILPEFLCFLRNKCKLTSSEIIVMMAILSHAPWSKLNGPGEIFPSRRKLMATTGMGETMVRRCLSRLQKRGVIVMEKRVHPKGADTSPIYHLGYISDRYLAYLEAKKLSVSRITPKQAQELADVIPLRRPDEV